jgi:putative endopeptidase
MLMMNKLTDSLVKTLESRPWLDDETKHKAISKAERILPFMGYPEWFENSDSEVAQQLNQIYGDPSNLANALDGSLVRVLSLVHAFKKKQNFGFLGLPKQPRGARAVTAGKQRQFEIYEDAVEVWKMAFMPNAFYSPEFNKIMLTLPFLYMVKPVAEDSSTLEVATALAHNFGGVGSILGHELTHAFDPNGRRSGNEGEFNMGITWSPQSAANYAENAERIAALYSTYSVDVGPVNGRLTLAENIADLGGFVLAYNALTEHLKGMGVPFDGPTSLEPFLVQRPGMTIEQYFFTSLGTFYCTRMSKVMKTRLLMDEHAPDEVS